jgi:hypothetical protein
MADFARREQYIRGIGLDKRKNPNSINSFTSTTSQSNTLLTPAIPLTSHLHPKSPPHPTFKMYTSLLTTLLFTTLAHSAALLKRADPGPTVWKSPNGGNTQVRFGDGKVDVGGCNPDYIIDSIYENCYEEGFCKSDAWTVGCMYGDRAKHDVTITAPEGQFQAKIRKEFIDALKAALKTDKVVSKRTVVATNGGGCIGCAFYSTKIDMYTMPSTFGISHTNDGTVPDVITISELFGGELGGRQVLTSLFRYHER